MSGTTSNPGIEFKRSPPPLPQLYSAYLEAQKHIKMHSNVMSWSHSADTYHPGTHKGLSKLSTASKRMSQKRIRTVWPVVKSKLKSNSKVTVASSKEPSFSLRTVENRRAPPRCSQNLSLAQMGREKRMFQNATSA